MGKKAQAKRLKRDEQRAASAEKRRTAPASAAAEDRRARAEHEFARLAWGESVDEVRQEARVLADQLGVALEFDVEFVDDAPEGSPHLARWDPAQNQILIQEKPWRTSPAWRRLQALAHEVFHAYQSELFRRASSGELRESDPSIEKIRTWDRKRSDLYDAEVVQRYRRGEVDIGQPLKMFERYADHPYEKSADEFGWDALFRRAPEIMRSAQAPRSSQEIRQKS